MCLAEVFQFQGFECLAPPTKKCGVNPQFFGSFGGVGIPVGD